MAVITAAAVQQNRTYVASGFVEDDYIRDDKQPTSKTLFGATRIANAGSLVASSATTLFGSSLTISSGGISPALSRFIATPGLLHKGASIVLADTRSIFGSELKWNLVSANDTSWNDRTVNVVTWVEDSPEQSAFTKQTAASSTWNKVVDDERPFG